mgnify:CR=1 FL=1
MNARTTLEIIAPTVEEAIAQGLAQLGLTADAVSVEVLDAGSKGLFGLGKTQVRVRDADYYGIEIFSDRHVSDADWVRAILRRGA